MDQRNLIEIHSALIADGWQIQAEIAERNRKGKACHYLLTHPNLQKKNLKVTLTYPVVSESQEYELVENDGSQIISSMTYTSETEAQYALLETCNKLTADTGDNAS